MESPCEVIQKSRNDPGKRNRCRDVPRSSNLQTKAVESESQYPLREFLDNGIKVTINTDNRTVSNTTMTKELQFIQEHYRITDEEIRLMMRDAVDTAFIH